MIQNRKKESLDNQKSGSSRRTFLILVVLALILFVGLIGVFIVILFGFLSTNTISSQTPFGLANVELIRINGGIVSDSQSTLFGGSSGASASRLVEKLDKIKDDTTVKGVIFEINSPGGSGVASEEIAMAIKDLNKPTVSYVREVGASGAYWIASATDYIIASRLSIVGSIGVYSSYLDFSQFINDWNIYNQRLVAGDKKDFGDPFRKLTQEEIDLYQLQLDELHSIFIQDVAKNRGMSYSQVNELADGFFYTGNQAVMNGLIDEIGGKKEAINYMENKLGSKINIIEEKNQTNIFDLFSESLQIGMQSMGKGIGETIFKKEIKVMA